MDYKDEDEIAFTILNQNEWELTVGQVFFLHPEKFNYRGGGWYGLTAIEPREDLGDILIDTTNHKTNILNPGFTIRIPQKSAKSFILKYSFLNPNHEYYEDWHQYREKMILGIRYYAFYLENPIQEKYVPLYRASKKEFDKTLTDLFKAIDDEWKEFCCPKAICDCQ